jgi:hypothetical protein
VVVVPPGGSRTLDPIAVVDSLVELRRRRVELLAFGAVRMQRLEQREIAEGHLGVFVLQGLLGLRAELLGIVQHLLDARAGASGSGGRGASEGRQQDDEQGGAKLRMSGHGSSHSSGCCTVGRSVGRTASEPREAR